MTMRVIDLDSHSRPRNEDLLLEDEFLHLKPRHARDSNGNMTYGFGDTVLRTLPPETVEKGDSRVKDWRTAHWDGATRFKNVAEAGIDYQFVSAGTVGGFNYVDAKPGAALCRAANNFIHDHFMKNYPGMFSGLPQLPLQDTREAMRELERCVNDLGMVTFLMPTNWNGIDMADPHWWDLYDCARRLGIKGIIVHRGGSMDPFIGKERIKVLGGGSSIGIRIVTSQFEYSANIVNLLFGGMMDRFPELRFAFLEGGVEFAVALKHKIEAEVKEIPYLEKQLAQPLKSYFDRMYFVVDDILLDGGEKRLQWAIDEMGADQLLFGSDYPHLDSHLEMCGTIKELEGISTEVKEKILGRNALALLGRNL